MSTQGTHPDDQINLNGLGPAVYNLLRFFFKLCGFIRIVIVRGIFIILGGLLLGICVALVLYKPGSHHYKGTMILTSARFSKIIFAGAVDQLNSVIANSSPGSLSKELNLSRETASQIIFFDAVNMLDQPLNKDTSGKLNQPFKIIIGLDQTDSIASIQKALVAYLNDLPFLKHVSEQEARIYSAKLKQIESDLSQLDSLKTIFNRFLATPKTGTTIYSSAVNPADIYKQSLHLVKEKVDTEKHLVIDNNAVSVVDECKVSFSSSSSSFARLALKTGIIGLMTGFIIAFLIETRKKIFP